MQQIEASYEQIGYADEKQVVVLHEAPAVPNDHENGEGHTDAEYLDNAVEKQKAMQSDDVETDEDRKVTKNNKYSPQGVPKRIFQSCSSHRLRPPKNLFTFPERFAISMHWRIAHVKDDSKGNSH